MPELISIGGPAVDGMYFTALFTAGAATEIHAEVRPAYRIHAVQPNRWTALRPWAATVVPHPDRGHKSGRRHRPAAACPRPGRHPGGFAGVTVIAVDPTGRRHQRGNGSRGGKRPVRVSDDD